MHRCKKATNIGIALKSINNKGAKNIKMQEKTENGAKSHNQNFKKP